VCHCTRAGHACVVPEMPCTISSESVSWPVRWRSEVISTEAPLSSTALFFLSQSNVTKHEEVAGAKHAQNEEEGGGADVSVDAGVVDKHAESVE